jgi:hypothetical protein
MVMMETDSALSVSDGGGSDNHSGWVEVVRMAMMITCQKMRVVVAMAMVVTVQ